MLTGFFVMLSEVLIYTPSVARFRLVYLQEKLETAYLAAQAVRVAPDGMLSEMMTKDLLNQVGAHTVILFRDGTAREMLERAPRPMADVEVDLRQETFFGLIWAAFESLSQIENRVLRVTGNSPDGTDSIMIVEIDEAPMRAEMFDYSIRILNLSIFISLVTAGLVFLSLRWLMVRPLERITRSMIAFQETPEDRTTDLDDQGRRDEIGTALRELAAMKEALRSALRQQTRLAALGTAVNKISHDLRNMLSTATLISDTLSQSDDPKVRRVAPTLIQSIDRAAALCSTTLNFTRDAPALKRTPVVLGDVMREIGGSELTTGEGGEKIRVESGYGANLKILADRDQVFRVFANLTRNAAHAGASRLSVDAWPREGMVQIDVSDNGPGIPETAQLKLFQPFGVTTKKDGNGLGLAIARDIIQAHGGTLTLAQTGPAGTRFTLTIPTAETTQ
jgi:signal transduction histidine kinase